MFTGATITPCISAPLILPRWDPRPLKTAPRSFPPIFRESPLPADIEKFSVTHFPLPAGFSQTSPVPGDPSWCKFPVPSQKNHRSPVPGDKNYRSPVPVEKKGPATR